MKSLLLLVAVSAWNGEKEEDPGRNRDVEGDKSDGNNFGALRRIIVGELNAATKSELPPPPPPLKKGSMLQYSCCYHNSSCNDTREQPNSTELMKRRMEDGIQQRKPTGIAADIKAADIEQFLR